MFKQVSNYKDIKDKINSAIDTICEPVSQTLSPKGANVIFEDDNGNISVTNDGVTIAKNISSKDPIENAIIQIIKHSALKTNMEAGDGTTSSTLLSGFLIKEGLKLIEDGWNPIILKKEFEKFGEALISKIKTSVKQIKNDKDLHSIATISANNDSIIAKDIVEVVKCAGENGLIFIEPSKKPNTEIIKDTGFVIKTGMFSPELRKDKSSFNVVYENTLVFLTDKRLYYHEEAEAIIKVALQNNYTSLVIVARDFIGQAVNTFIANHSTGNINILLIKEPNTTEKNIDRLEDLAIYLGGKVITDKRGRIVDKISIKDFIVARKIYSDISKTIIQRKEFNSKELTERIKSLKIELEKEENPEIKERLSSLTNGMVTIKVGGSTPIEVNERIYRYEDAVNATRAAQKDGYLVGGGISLIKAFQVEDYNPELIPIFRKYSQAILRRIAKNCGKHEDSIIEKVLEGSMKSMSYGYNALTDKFEDLLKAGVIEPFKVTEMVIKNSISVTGVIISSKYLITNIIEKENGK